MSGFISAKRWELLLAAALPVVIPLLDAVSSGAFHGKTLGEAVLMGVLVAARALASHQQSPPVTQSVTVSSGRASFAPSAVEWNIGGSISPSTPPAPDKTADGA